MQNFNLLWQIEPLQNWGQKLTKMASSAAPHRLRILLTWIKSSLELVKSMVPLNCPSTQSFEQSNWLASKEVPSVYFWFFEQKVDIQDLMTSTQNSYSVWLCLIFCKKSFRRIVKVIFHQAKIPQKWRKQANKILASSSYI